MKHSGVMALGLFSLVILEIGSYISPHKQRDKSYYVDDAEQRFTSIDPLEACVCRIVKTRYREHQLRLIPALGPSLQKRRNNRQVPTSE